MPKGVPRVALWALLVLMLAAVLAPVPGVRAASPSNYALNGVVTTAANVPVPGGVTVDLISGATQAVYTTTTTAGGSFSFTNPGTSGALVPGYWGLYVPPQGNLTLRGCRPCGILPSNEAPSYTYETAQNLTSATSLRTITGVSVLEYNATIFGNATQGTSPAAGANVQLLAAGFNGFVLSNNTTLNAGNFSLKVPWGTWVLRTTLPGVPDQFDYQQVTVNAARLTVNPSISKYLTYGTVYQQSNPTAQVPYAGNATVYDVANQYTYSTPTLNGGFYAVGTYPAGFSGSGSNTFDVFLQTIGYHTVWYPLTVSGSNTTGGVPHNVWTSAQYDPAVYSTDLNYSKGFDWLNTSTQVALSNDSTFPQLPNASVGQLWAQAALDWQHNLSFDSANVPALEAWIESAGPFFPAGAAQAKVNSSGYNESMGGNFSFSTGCTTGWCGVTSAAGIQYSWSKNYQLNGTLAGNATSYTVSFNFRHPTNYESINYTVNLPNGYALQAGTSAPSNSRLVADGPGGTWTKFTLVSEPSANPSGSASFTFVKYGKVTANVNATVSQFAFSTSNVLNSTHGNYSVLVGVGQNVSFSAAGSSFPTGINGSRYAWTWGDGSPVSTTTQAVAYHTYAASGEFNGSLNLTSSGGTYGTVTFHVYVGSGAVSGSIVSNATANETKTAGTTTYLEVNWSTSLQFNASGFSSTLYANGPSVPLSVAAWNATDGPENATSNFTAGSKAYVADNFTVTFTANSDPEYLSGATIGGSPVSFLGWQYNITVRVWSAIGQYATDELIVLVKDTQKPVAVATLQNAAGTNVTSSGLVEGSNHTVKVLLVGKYSYDPNGGGLTTYLWNVSNSGNSSVDQNITQHNRTGLQPPVAYPLWLSPQTKPYTVNLTVTDRAGNTQYNVATITVAVNTSTRPVLVVSNLTAASSMTDGSSYTVWANVTNTIGANSTAVGVQVAFYLLPPSGSGSPVYIAGGPSHTTFYTYANGTDTVNATLGTGSVTLKYNETVRAQVTFTPGLTGTYELWANATASNEFAGDYATGDNEQHVTVNLSANNTMLDIEYGVIAVVVIVAILGFVWFRYYRTPKSTKSSGRSSDRSPAKKPETKPADDEDDE